MNARQVALVTGASTGIGRAIAARLAGDGYVVFGTSRNPATAKALPGVTLLPLDVTDDGSVAALVRAVLESAGRIDLLVNNAGVVVMGGVEEVQVTLAAQQFETNYFGVLRMIQAVLPAMRAQNSGHIINLGSVAGHVAIPFAGQYSATKFALDGLSESLRHEVAGFGIKVALVEPGFFKTELIGSAAGPSQTLNAYDAARTRVHHRIREIETAAPPPTAVADLVLRLARHPDPPLRNLVGKEKIFVTLKRLLPYRWFEPSTRKYWRLTS